MKYMVIGGEFGDEEFFYDSLEEAALHNTHTIYVVDQVLIRKNVNPEYTWVKQDMPTYANR